MKLKKREKQLIKELDRSMSLKETIGALGVIISGAIIFLGLQNLGNSVTISGTSFPISWVGIILILVGIGIVIWIIKSILD